MQQQQQQQLHSGLKSLEYTKQKIQTNSSSMRWVTKTQLHYISFFFFPEKSHENSTLLLLPISALPSTLRVMSHYSNAPNV